MQCTKKYDEFIPHTTFTEHGQIEKAPFVSDKLAS